MRQGPDHEPQWTPADLVLIHGGSSDAVRGVLKKKTTNTDFKKDTNTYKRTPASCPKFSASAAHYAVLASNFERRSTSQVRPQPLSVTSPSSKVMAGNSLPRSLRMPFFSTSTFLPPTVYDLHA